MHRIQAKLTAYRSAEEEAKNLRKPIPATIAGTVVEVLEKVVKMDASTGVAPLYDAIEAACREAIQSGMRETPRQHGLIKAIAELEAILPGLHDTRWVAGDLANVEPRVLRSPA